MDKDTVKSNIKRRLNRIEGQIRGIQRMIDNDEECGNVLIQIAAVRSAINRVGGLVLENYAQSCIKNAAKMDDNEQSVSELIDTVIKFTK